MRTVNFGKNLRLSQIQPIKTAGIKSIQFGKKKGKTLHPVYKNINDNKSKGWNHKYVFVIWVVDFYNSSQRKVQGVRFFPSFFQTGYTWFPPFWLVESEKDVGQGRDIFFCE